MYLVIASFEVIAFSPDPLWDALNIFLFLIFIVHKLLSSCDRKPSIRTQRDCLLFLGITNDYTIIIFTMISILYQKILYVEGTTKIIYSNNINNNFCMNVFIDR